jgi:hypothetical protein
MLHGVRKYKTGILEQSPQLTNPTWTSVDTRMGDGLEVQIIRPANAALNMFFRLRTE